ncbi:Glu-tRNA(Gln) amidotransferase subunit GatE [Methanothrix sp.]|uniref:Glu-tRNA(Gln) amidotransferase subunit GatE n=1 Tax=Methanothrix sp. TaxID=90426 RepID=UPI00257FC745|nr:Glu-tRNA(Gln) amidotransferase subunit GatE [Methanothrix sp.]NPU88149.1 Glu-tRNA(Gln) amidotransferase subunit GatE [Methanothrix sp.]
MDYPDMDYRALGLVCGIEIHQQLDTRCKLFCSCPTVHREVEDSNFEFFRYLRPARSELGEIDRAALEETLVSRRFVYKSYNTTCLVEADEEPPRELNREALEIALVIARLLKMRIVDEIHTMRKTVIDGSNTSGFQRTAFIASSGSIDTSCGPVGIGILCLEEEAARIVEDRGDEVVYSLDRLGIPLVEIGTAPDIVSPQHAREVAQHIGMILRSTGRVKRGLGTIRQDVNVSIAGGARVEIKGVQELNLIERIVELEVIRQVRLLEIRDELRRRNARVCGDVVDATGLFSNTRSKVVAKALKSGGAVLATKLAGFKGIIGKEVQPGRRLGTELSDRAKRAGVGGIFHTDELPAYGITEEEVSSLRSLLSCEESDAVAMVAAPPERARKAIEAVIERAREAIAGVPEETRRALPDGTSEYMRPLPGSARMYPETDVPPVVVNKEMVERLRLPELVVERAERYQREYGLSPEQARIMAASSNYQLFEEIVRVYGVQPSLVVRSLESTPVELARDGVPVYRLSERHFMGCFDLLAQNRIAKEGIPALLKAMAENPDADPESAAEAAGLMSLGASEVERIVHEIVSAKVDLVRERGERAIGPLMGLAMEQLRGKADGAAVSALIKKEINAILGKAV